VPTFIGRGASATALRQSPLVDPDLCRGAVYFLLSSVADGNVALQVHAVVQEADDFDRSFCCIRK
jgi:hypothetical protein